MEETNLLIKDAFEVISLILVFAFVLFDIRYPQINKALDKVIPPEELRQERSILAKNLRQSFLSGVLPLVIIYGVMLYLFSPLLITTITNTKLNLWRFDFIITAFVLVYFFILFFFIWSVYLAVKLILRIREVYVPGKE